MEFRDLEYFAVLAEHRHVGRAAEALGLSQPALSLSLRRLEKSLQTKLVKRTPKGVELTQVGAAFLARVSRLRLARDEVTREVADLSQGRAGDLRIGVSPGTGENLVAAAGNVLLRAAPGATFKITVSPTNLLVSRLRDGELDFIVGNAVMLSHPELTMVNLYEDEFVAYVSFNHPLAKRKNLKLADLADQRWAVSASDGYASRLRDLNWPFAEHDGLPLQRIAVESNSTAVRVQMVAAGTLIGWSSRQFLRQVDPQFRLVELPIKEMRVPRTMVLAYRKDAYLSPVAKRFVETLNATTEKTAADSRGH